MTKIIQHKVIRKMRKCVWQTLLCTILTLCALSAKAQDLTISNNLLYDATLTPNLRIGYQVDPKWSIAVTGGFRHWPRGNYTTKKWRHLLISPSVRHWKDSVQVGQFWGANAMYSHFNAGYTDMVIYKGVKDERRQGDLVAIGAFYGYKWRLSCRWAMEVFGGLAVGYAWYDRFLINDAGDNWLRNGSGNGLFLLPQLGLNVVYRIPLRKSQTIPIDKILLADRTY